MCVYVCVCVCVCVWEREREKEIADKDGGVRVGSIFIEKEEHSTLLEIELIITENEIELERKTEIKSN